MAFSELGWQPWILFQNLCPSSIFTRFHRVNLMENFMLNFWPKSSIENMWALNKPLHGGAFWQFPFWWIYYCHISKSTGKETDKTHLCALFSIYTLLCNFWLNIGWLLHGIWIVNRHDWLSYDVGPIKVNQKMAFFGFEIWKPRKWNISLVYKLGIKNPGFQTQIWEP